MTKFIVVTLIAFAALVLSLLPDRAFARQDQVGNVFPAWCTTEAINAARSNVSIMRVEPQAMNSSKDINHSTLAVWIPMPGRSIIMVSDRLAGWKAADAEEHELCHEVTYQLYPATKGQWHK